MAIEVKRTPRHDTAATGRQRCSFTTSRSHTRAPPRDDKAMDQGEWRIESKVDDWRERRAWTRNLLRTARTAVRGGGRGAIARRPGGRAGRIQPVTDCWSRWTGFQARMATWKRARASGVVATGTRELLDQHDDRRRRTLAGWRIERRGKSAGRSGAPGGGDEGRSGRDHASRSSHQER